MSAHYKMPWYIFKDFKKMNNMENIKRKKKKKKERWNHERRKLNLHWKDEVAKNNAISWMDISIYKEWKLDKKKKFFSGIYERELT